MFFTHKYVESGKLQYWCAACIKNCVEKWEDGSRKPYSPNSLPTVQLFKLKDIKCTSYSPKYFLRWQTRPISTYGLHCLQYKLSLNKPVGIDMNIISVNPLVDSLPSKQRKLPSMNPYKYLARQTDGLMDWQV